MTDRTALSVKHLSVRDSDRARMVVDDASFDVAPGEFLCLVGPSGSGKSTTALGIMGLLRAPLEIVSGAGTVAGQSIAFADPSALAELRGRSVSMIFQDPFSSLNPVLRCGRQVEEPLKIHTSLSSRARRERVLDLFEETGFEDPVRAYESLPRELSGGQIQRVLIAMAICLEPALLLADEPTTALDIESQRAIIALLQGLQRRRGMAVVLITHDLDLARSVSARIVHMHDGQIMPTADGTISGEEVVTSSGGRRPLIDASGQPCLMTIRELSKTFLQRGVFGGEERRVTALDDVSLDINVGEIVGIVGPSGSGKTTMGRCLAGLETPDRGCILLEGAPVWANHRRGQLSPVQVIYQSPYASLNPMMLVGHAIEEGLRSRGMRRRERREETAQLLEHVRLPAAYYDRFPKELSGGERQRVVIARALAADPKVLVADEPTASLDEHTANEILDLLRRLAHELGLGVLLISHDRKAIARAADRVVALDKGRLEIRLPEGGN